MTSEEISVLILSAMSGKPRDEVIKAFKEIKNDIKDIDFDLKNYDKIALVLIEILKEDRRIRALLKEGIRRLEYGCGHA